jgi:hypothetical protein
MKRYFIRASKDRTWIEVSPTEFEQHFELATGQQMNNLIKGFASHTYDYEGKVTFGEQP